MSRTIITFLLTLFVVFKFSVFKFSLAQENTDWLSVGNDRGYARYGDLAQINQKNVAKLKVAWEYSTGEGDKTCECTPLIIDGVMYISTNHLRVVALNAATGKELWSFDPFEKGRQYSLASGGVNRGVAFWTDGKAARILHGTSDGQLFSLDAKTGKLDQEFGDKGVKDLREDIKRDLSKLSYGPTSAPAIIGDVVVLGFSNGEGPGPSAPGDIRAFDVKTGKQVWRFHTVPREGEFGNDSWAGDSWRERGGANAWGGISVDVERGIVFAGLGSAAFDFYGGDRLGDNLFANCTVALDAKTGKRIWHFQTLRHDLWDHDLPCPPTLVSVKHNGKAIDAVAQPTKTGYIFLFNRETGEPLFEIKELPTTQSDMPGEKVAETQPAPIKPPPIARQSFTEDDVTDVSEAARREVLAELKKLKPGGMFAPPSFEGTVVIPGFHGGATWSAASFDPETGVLYINANNVPNIMGLKKAKEGAKYAYTHKGYRQFRDSNGYPAIKPPWGELLAIDLNSGEFVWRVPLGEYSELTKQGVPQTGTENFGGTIVTKGGLVFIGGTKDEKFRAFDKSTGEVLWEHQLPFGGYATPSTYSVNGRQFVVIAACGGGKPGTKPGDKFIAFALPE